MSATAVNPNKNNLRFRLRQPLYLLLSAVYLLWSFWGGSGLQALFGLLVFGGALLALPDAKGSNLIISAALFLLGAFCLLFKGAPAGDWLTALTSNGGLVAMFITLPLFSVLLAYNDYVGAMEQLFHRYVRRSWMFFSLAAILAGVLGSVMNLGGMTLMYELLKPYRPQYGSEKQMAQALTRGNLSMSYWAPCHMSVATAVAYTGISWIELAPKGILLSLLQLLVACLYFYVAGGKKGRQIISFPSSPQGDTEEIPAQGGRRVLTELLLVYAGLVLLVALLNKFTSLAVLAIISLAAFLYPVLAGVVLRKWHIFKLGWQDYREKKLGGIVNQVLLFSAVGFFGKALELSGAGELVIGKLNMEAWAQPSFLVMGIALVMWALAMVGVHPVVPMIALATTLNPELLPLSPLQFAYAYLLGYSVSVTTSPFSAVALTISGLNGQGPWQGMGRYNIIYSCLLILLFSLIIPLI